MKKPLIRTLLLLAAVGNAPATWAVDLVEAYGQALDSDPQFQGAMAQNRAAQEASPQARAGLLPGAALSADTTANWFDPGGQQFNSHGYTLSISQPVFHRDRWIQLAQADDRIKQADTQLAAARQELMIRVASRYFDVLSATDTLEFARKTKDAIGHQLKQARQRFEVGLIAITDVEESKAAYDLAVADEIAAENSLDNAGEALREITGVYHDVLSPLGDGMQLVRPDPADIDQWTRVALEQNLGLTAAHYAAEVARREIRRRRAGHFPTLDLVGSRNYSSSGGGSFGARKTMTDSLGLQLNVPLYAGGLVVSQTREGRHLYQQALDAQEQARRSAQRQTREAYLGVTAGISRVKALKQALTSTETALRATEAGFQVGTRTSVDVVVAQKDTFQSRRDHKAARYAYVLNTLSLKQAAGTLSEDDLQQVNRWLD